jgi:hypothetical protein
MNGTPEGDQLWKHLRLGLEDKKHTGLDDLTVFLASDLVQDPDLIKLLDKCGCGHLFKFGKSFDVSELSVGYAADIRKHLGLASNWLDNQSQGESTHSSERTS